MVINDFNSIIAPLEFGVGIIKKLDEHILKHGKNVLIITGGSSLKKSGKLDEICTSLSNKGINYIIENVTGEPTIDIVDKITEDNRDKKPDVIVSIGGGSVIDTGKAVSAMLVCEGKVIDYLEGVGTKKPTGDKIPFIACPTTAGTGTEMTKNAVIKSVGKNGFKKSLRHDNYIPDIALIDSDLYTTCPLKTASLSALDALAQLLESYISIKATPLTEAICESGIKYFMDGANTVLIDEKSKDVQAWGKLAYGAMCSGIGLANAGYMTIHGIAGPLGGYYELPHGAACGMLLLKYLENFHDKIIEYPKVLSKYAYAGRCLTKNYNTSDLEAFKALLDFIIKLTNKIEINSLKDFGIKIQDIDKIINASTQKNDPVKLTYEELKALLLSTI